MSNKIESVAKNLPTQKSPGLVNSTKDLKKSQHQLFSNSSKKKKKKERTFPNSLMKLGLPSYQSQTGTLQEKKITRQYP